MGDLSDEALLGALILHPHTYVVSLRHGDHRQSRMPYVIRATVLVGVENESFVRHGESLSETLAGLIHDIDRVLRLAPHNTAANGEFDERIFESAAKLLRHSGRSRLSVWGEQSFSTEFGRRVEIEAGIKCFVQTDGTLVKNLQKALWCAWEELGWEEA